ncbi:MAG: Lrp/AsnC family transcriptional regulator [Candidatus Bathycorpusculaceae bacterium]
MSKKVDRTDRKIIEALQEDARIPFTEIGTKLGVSDATIHVRVKKMLKAGIIKKYTVIVNESTFGRNVAGYMLLKVKSGSIEEVSKKLVELESVTMIQELHGSSDILLRIGTPDLESFRDAIREIQAISDVVASEYFTVLKAWKE